MTPEERQHALDVARDAAQTSGELLAGYLGRLDEARFVRKSSVLDLQTEADLASERHLVGVLREAFPEYAIEAEEEVRDALDDRPRWFRDPLDGTSNFVHGIPLFAVSLGLLVGNRPEVAVVHLPVLRETYVATRAGGAFLESERGRQPLQVSDKAALGEAVLGTGFPYRRWELEDNNLANFERLFAVARGLRRTGSAATDLAFTAAGRLDGFWELHLGPHDLAAGVLLVREAGGIVTDPAGGDDWLRTGHVVAAGPGLHAELLERVHAGRNPA